MALAADQVVEIRRAASMGRHHTDARLAARQVVRGVAHRAVASTPRGVASNCSCSVDLGEVEIESSHSGVGLHDDGPLGDVVSTKVRVPPGLLDVLDQPESL